jgi:carbon-monoxide dehydrogenase medium subunit
MFDLRTLERPTSPEEAVRAFLETEGTGLYVAGGSIVVPTASQSLDYLVDLTATGLDYMRVEDGTDGAMFVIGAMTRIADLLDSDLPAGAPWGAITGAARSVANHTVRNRATVGGNIFAAHYPSDLPAALLVLRASVVLQGTEGTRTVALEDFFGRGGDVYRRGDLITEVRVPRGAPGLASAFIKLGRTRVDVAIVNSAAAIRIEDGVIADAAIALNGISSAPFVAADASAHLVGREPTAETFSEAARIVTEAVSPRSDHRAGAEYRKKMAGVVVARALEAAAGKCGR